MNRKRPISDNPTINPALLLRRPTFLPSPEETLTRYQILHGVGYDIPIQHSSTRQETIPGWLHGLITHLIAVAWFHCDPELRAIGDPNLEIIVNELRCAHGLVVSEDLVLTLVCEFMTFEGEVQIEWLGMEVDVPDEEGVMGQDDLRREEVRRRILLGREVVEAYRASPVPSAELRREERREMLRERLGRVSDYEERVLRDFEVVDEIDWQQPDPEDDGDEGVEVPLTRVSSGVTKIDDSEMQLQSQQVQTSERDHQSPENNDVQADEEPDTQNPAAFSRRPGGRLRYNIHRASFAPSTRARKKRPGVAENERIFNPAQVLSNSDSPPPLRRSASPVKSEYQLDSVRSDFAFPAARSGSVLRRSLRKVNSVVKAAEVRRADAIDADEQPDRPHTSPGELHTDPITDHRRTRIESRSLSIDRHFTSQFSQPDHERPAEEVLPEIGLSSRQNLLREGLNPDGPALLDFNLRDSRGSFMNPFETDDFDGENRHLGQSLVPVSTFPSTIGCELLNLRRSSCTVVIDEVAIAESPDLLQASTTTPSNPSAPTGVRPAIAGSLKQPSVPRRRSSRIQQQSSTVSTTTPSASCLQLRDQGQRHQKQPDNHHPLRRKCH